MIDNWLYEGKLSKCAIFIFNLINSLGQYKSAAVDQVGARSVRLQFSKGGGKGEKTNNIEKLGYCSANAE